MQDKPNKKDPSCNASQSPSISHNSLPEDIPRNILAFRTITTLLSRIQQGRASQVPQPYTAQLNRDERRELKISNAFSTLAVIEHEIVAVVTNRDTETLEVIASIQSPNDNFSYIERSNSLFSGLTSQNFQSVEIPQNHSKDAPQPTVLSTAEAITDAKVLAGLALVDDEAIKLSHPTAAKHLWILSKLLCMKEPSNDGPKRDITALINRIRRYIIATCYPKMNRRMQHRLSRSYVQSLGGITAFQFSESERDGLPPKDEIESDRRFLVNILLPLASDSIYKTKTPKLLEQAQLAYDLKPFQLYTNETCTEFHQLFIEILQGFETSLDELAQTRGAEEVSTRGSDEFKENVRLVLVHGYGLQMLSKGAGLKMHLKTIAPLLINNPVLRSESEMSILNAGAEQQELELDRDVEAVRPFASKEGAEIPLWMSYINWLELMVTYFDAVSTLVCYVTGQYFNHEAISIRILVAPPVDRRLLPWQELFADSTLFPTLPDYDAGFSCAGWHINNADILEFLSNALDTLSKAEAAKITWDEKDVKQTILNIEAVQSFKLPEWEERAEDILVKLRGLDGLSPGADLVQEISTDIRSLCKSSTFFTSLEDNRGFSGTLHCEACLGFQVGSIIGSSERRGGVIARDSHNSVTACTLPTWLPGNIVDSMNQHFGGLLRQKLVDMIVKHTRNCT
ncbi:hypothetical protein HYPSUDRAFT_57717 [Hypholoma sublateritium FD-334 SS-4]|uniref:Uncharacterized protein n=1 Tax=Hypholoma sublateritium (strain FD-334 SS-4) TaxID=945553 RepID=A0A0D2M2Q7_HYPSF|nr:hypothetical protein HYPSUDRAFT_57717 [Hypholoma sublateritium FD-334 SS-4]